MSSPPQRVAGLLSVYGSPTAGAAELLCDGHPAGAVAFTVVSPDLSSIELTYGELRERSSRFAAYLAELGVGRGDRVATLMGKSAELVVAMLAIWRLGAVQVPLFTALAAPAIDLRVTGSGAKVVVADAGQRAKLGPGVLVVDVDESRAPLDSRVAVGGDGILIELYTSGTTGPPKGVQVPLRAVAAIRMYQEYGLDQRPQDVFWNAADPGWAYGLYYAIVGPLALGLPGLLLRGGFSAELTWRVLSSFGVTNFAAGPTVYRALRNADPSAPLALRHCSSAGEPLGPDVIAWACEVLGVPVLDHYGQTELGMALANGWHPDIRGELRPGSMGRSLPGWQLEVLDSDGAVAPPGVRGRVAVDTARSPLMWFTGEPWYLTGDTATRDSDGYFYFAARDDDVILMAGYRIGPFEVESVLVLHEAVAEAAVVGLPDPLRGEVVAAFVVLRSGVEPSESLVGELQRLVKTGLAAHAYPREVRFVAELPKTPSGKIQRFLLRQDGQA